MDASGYASPATTPDREPSTRRRDPLSIMLGNAERWDIITVFVGVAFSLHVAMLTFAMVSSLLAQLHSLMGDNRAALHDFFWRQYDVEVVKPKDEPKPEPPPPEPPPPEPAPAPVVKQAPKPVEEDPYKNLAPTPAKAAKVLTAEPKPDDPVELPTIVSGEGTALGGMQSAAGTGERITMAKAANINGTPGGRGSVVAPPPPPPPPTEDKSRPVGLAGSASWNCPFPPEADADQIDRAVVGVSVTVRADGSAASISVVNDPGHGFGRAAKSCALARSYKPALDRSGTAITTTATINVHFNR
jgi:protein TonB